MAVALQVYMILNVVDDLPGIHGSGAVHCVQPQLSGSQRQVHYEGRGKRKGKVVLVFF